MAESIQGIVINEILPDPSGTANNFDTDGDGSFEANDEFVELFNTSSDPVDISGWTLSDGETADPDFIFPAGTIIAAGEHVTIVGGWDNGALPDGFFELGATGGTWNNGGEEIILSDGTNTIVATYGSFESGDIPVGAASEDFGNDTDGQSIRRSPDGSDTFAVATPTPECFLTGTRILTENGYKLVEDLKIGERVQTAEGKLELIKWIGHQTINPNQVTNSLRGYPVLIKAGALGNNLPHRDLFVSPDHSLWVDGLLINAGALVNDVSIIKTEPQETFIYYHIELENHCLLLAEGTAAESYLPQKENREEYDNYAEYEALYPQGSNLMLWPMDYPRISSWNKVPTFVREKLMKIAHQMEDSDMRIKA
ncbi:MAG: Hint domain-containing protein [Cyanobacteria bacterium J06621_8]